MAEKAHCDWARLRPHITKLYMDEDRSLKEVMEVMEKQHRFYANARMYKHRLKKWGLMKNFKEDQIIQMCLMKQQREAAGKDSVFLVQGRPVDWDQVNNYLKRRPDLEMKIRAGMIKLRGISPDLSCRSPSPDPVLPISEALETSNEMLHLLQGYYTMVFGFGESKDISFDNQVDNSAVFISSQRRLFQAQLAIPSPMMQHGFMVLKKSLDNLRHVVKLQDVRLLFYLCDFLTAFDFRYEALASKVHLHTYDLLVTTLGNDHPLVLLVYRMLRLPDDTRYDVIALLLQAAVDTLSRHMKDSRTLERVKSHQYILVETMGLKDSNSKAKFPDARPSSIDAASADYHCRLADCLIFARQFDAAQSLLKVVGAWASDPQNQEDSAWKDIQLAYYASQTRCAWDRGDMEGGVTWWQNIRQHGDKYFPDG